MTTVRRAGTTSVTVLSGLVVTLGFAHAAAPEWTKRAWQDVWNLSELRQRIRDISEEEDELARQSARLHEEIEAVDHITARLINGSLSLEEATTQSEPVMRGRTGFAETANWHYPAPTFRGSVARYLIDRVHRVLGTDPSQWATVSQRLEEEYALLK